VRLPKFERGVVAFVPNADYELLVHSFLGLAFVARISFRTAGYKAVRNQPAFALHRIRQRLSQRFPAGYQ
jgi:hypothetical protein